jgi:hypothetical protein
MKTSSHVLSAAVQPRRSGEAPAQAKRTPVRTGRRGVREGDARKPGIAQLARTVAEVPDAEGLLLLIEIEGQQKRSFVSRRTIEKAVTEHVPLENWTGAYEIIPVPAVELRGKLLAMTTDGGLADTAARALREIDEIRNEYGSPDAETRHPDLGSGKVWPILAAD